MSDWLILCIFVTELQFLNCTDADYFVWFIESMAFSDADYAETVELVVDYSWTIYYDNGLYYFENLCSLQWRLTMYEFQLIFNWDFVYKFAYLFAQLHLLLIMISCMYPNKITSKGSIASNACQVSLWKCLVICSFLTFLLS